MTQYAIYRVGGGHFLGWVSAENRRDAEKLGRRKFGGKIKIGGTK